MGTPVTGLELLVGVVLGGLVVGLWAMQLAQRAELARHEARLRELGVADTKVLEHVERVDRELHSQINREKTETNQLLGAQAGAIKEHADTLARLCSKAGVRFGKDA